MNQQIYFNELIKYLLTLSKEGLFMNKKIILGLSLVLIAVMAFGSASAFDLDSFLGGGENQTVTIDGIDFNIPAGFKEDPKQAKVNQMNEIGGVTYTTNGKIFEKGSTYVAILVADYGKHKVTDDVVKNVGGTRKTINNVSGYISHDGDNTLFNYAKNDKLVIISTTDENVISDFIIE